MPLHERVGEIFLANNPAQERTDFSDSLARFLVDDIGTTDREELSVVLLVESPHIHEILYRYPLAGGAGICVRDILGKTANRLFPNEPIGKSIYDDHPDFLRLGVMNVSRLPMQDDAYRPFRNDACEYGFIPQEENGDCRDDPEWNNYTGHMNTIRKPALTRIDPDRQALDNAIVEDLRGRLSCLHENYPDILLVCCGVEVAQSFYNKAANWEPVIVMPDACNLPHPSRNGWQTLNPQEGQCLQDIVARLW